MEVVGIGKYFEDLPLGLKFRTIGRTVTESDIINVINATGMLEVLFTNTEYLKNESVIKGRLVPAILILGFAEGQLMQTVLQKMKCPQRPAKARTSLSAWSGRKQIMSMTTSRSNCSRKSNASSATRTHASGSSPLTWNTGTCRPLAMSEGSR